MLPKIHLEHFMNFASTIIGASLDRCRTSAAILTILTCASIYQPQIFDRAHVFEPPKKKRL